TYTFTLGQAGRPRWRSAPHRDEDLKVVAHKDTMQERCLRLMGRKLPMPLAMEGKFSAEGLQAVGDEDLLMAMARELVTEKGVGESAAAVWRELQKRHDETFGMRQETEAMVPAEAGAAISSPTQTASTPLSTF